jgi:methanogenic corrinoid protein MtbC1
MPPTEKPGVIEAGASALRNLMSNPLKRQKSDPNEFSREHGCATLGEDAINTIIESEIIPRLLLAHSIGPSATAQHKSEIPPSEAQRFASLPLNTEAAGLMEEVDKFLAQGVSLDAIYIDLLAPAARRLGDMWSADECDFMDVTMGLWRLQEVMRDIAARTPRPAPTFAAPRRILVAPMPGDQHTFGAHMLEEIFAGAGWQSQVLALPERREILNALSHRAFDLAALTITRDCPSAAITSLIKAMRGVSVNPHLSVIIGGNAVNNNPALVAEVGADGTGSDGRAALLVADRLIKAAPVHAHELR